MTARRLLVTLLTGVLVAALAAVAGAPPAGAAGGTLDPLFGDGGTTVFSLPDRHSFLRAVATTPDGGMFAAGNGVVARFDAAGRLDPAFDGDGLAVPSAPVDAQAMAVLPDGRPVVAGTGTAPGSIRLSRFLRDGSPDTSLGTTGTVVDPADPDGAFNVTAMALQPDGRILVTGFFGPLADAALATVAEMFVVRYLPSGARDPGFGTGGLVRIPFSTAAEARAVAVQADGRIVLAGAVAGPGNSFAVVRLTTTGVPDATFGTNGIALTPIPGASGGAQAVAVQPDGAILAAGPVVPTLLADAAQVGVVRYLPTGTPDPGFGTGGIARTDNRPLLDGFSLGVRRDGRIVVGAVETHLVGTFAVLAAQFLPTGAPDPGYGTGGVGAATFGSLMSLFPLNATAVQADGRVVAVGGRATIPAIGFTAGFAARLSASPLEVADPEGYWMLDGSGRVYAFGDAAYLGDPYPTIAAGAAFGVTAVDLVPTTTGDGYWVLDNVGRVFAFGDAVHRGNVSAGDGRRTIALAASGDGYIGFGPDLASVTCTSTGCTTTLPSFVLNQPVVDAAPASGTGTYAAAADGGVFALGAPFHGSMGGIPLNQPVTGIAVDPDGTGYWLVAADGGIFAFAAPFLGSLGHLALNQPVTDMTAWGDGYLLVGADGGVFVFGSQPFVGSLGNTPPTSPVIAIAAI
jgi:uncharacterized delta-60 repeat protein